MEKPPMEWIDKIFNCMFQFYGEKWSKFFSHKDYDSLAKTTWQSALQGLTYEEIRRALVFHKRRTQYHGILPPSHLQFFWDAKNTESRNIHEFKRKVENKSDPTIARREISSIRSKLDRNNSLMFHVEQSRKKRCSAGKEELKI